MSNLSLNNALTRLRFDAKWIPEPNTGCFLWFGCREQGYGRIRIDQRKYLAHVLSWEWANCRSAKGQVVRHRCDTPCCVNPDHLEIGSIADNMRDRDERGRTARGERNGARLHPDRLSQRKLTESDVREIRTRLLIESCRSIARSYGMSRTAIHKIKMCMTWKRVADA